MKNRIQKVAILVIAFCALNLSGIQNAAGATFVVDDKGDGDNLAGYTLGDGSNTLRKCLRLANANVGLDNINFNIPAAQAPFIIIAATQLPVITSPVIINGLTQPGAAAGSLLIEVDGSGNAVFELNTGSTGSTIQGLVLYGTNRGLFVLNSNNTTIIANNIGTNLAATAVAASTILWNGIELDNSSNTIIGGISGITTRNIISGVGEQAIRIQNNSTGTQIMGNYIGTNGTATASIPNGQNGILLLPGSNNTTIGGATTNHRNIISGNLQRGMLIENSSSCIVRNNFIGTTVTGNAALGNSTRGIEVINTSPNIQITDNVICSNGQHGMSINNSARPVIKGNKLGLALNGTTALGNSEHGMEVNNCRKPVIGGSLLAERNYASNNGFSGIRIDNGDSAIVRGNYVGVDATGLVDHGNSQSGISIGASDTITIGGALAGEGNIISGNAQHGISIAANPTTRAIIKGNVIGLGSDLNTSLGNTQLGIELTDCENSIIGGSTVNERNYVAAGGANGIQLVNSPYSLVKGNYVGVDGTGLLNRGNNADGIRTVNSREVIIGGATAGERNIVCGSINSSAIVLDGDSKRCTVKGNFLGIGADGVTDIGNYFSGILLFGTSDTATIGGSTFMERNVSSCNGKSGVGDGIRVEGPDGHIIKGNFLGVDSTGTIAKGNAWAGLSLNESNDNTIGGSGAFEGNICSGNKNEGVWLRNASRNNIFGNFVGTDRSRTLQLGNEDWGLAISAAGPNFDNIVGGSLANANTIAYNQNIAGSGSGVDVSSDSHRNLITFNKIFCNAGLGIRLVGAGNEAVAAPIITSSLTNDVSGTGTPGLTIHIYRNVTSDGGVKCDCEGEIYIGTTTVTGAGTWTFNHGLALSTADAGAVTATQTTALNSTSQFSNCSPPLPVEYLYFTAKKVETRALLNWATSSEKNNKEFEIQRSIDGINFTPIGKVAGSNYSYETKTYSFIDENPPASDVYYRLIQIDYDGKFSISPIRKLSFASAGISIIAYQENEIRIESLLKEESQLTVLIFSASGQLCYQGTYNVSQGFYEKYISLNHLATGIYLVKVYNSEEQVVKKIELKSN